MGDMVICRQHHIRRGGISFSYYHENCYKEDEERLKSIEAGMSYEKFSYRTLLVKDILSNDALCSGCYEKFHKMDNE